MLIALTTFWNFSYLSLFQRKYLSIINEQVTYRTYFLKVIFFLVIHRQITCLKQNLPLGYSSQLIILPHFFLSPSYIPVNVLQIDCSSYFTHLFLMIFDHFLNSNLRHKSQTGRLWNLSPHLLPSLTQMIHPLSRYYLLTSTLNSHPS